MVYNTYNKICIFLPWIQIFHTNVQTIGKCLFHINFKVLKWNMTQSCWMLFAHTKNIFEVFTRYLNKFLPWQAIFIMPSFTDVNINLEGHQNRITGSRVTDNLLKKGNFSYWTKCWSYLVEGLLSTGPTLSSLIEYTLGQGGGTSYSDVSPEAPL